MMSELNSVLLEGEISFLKDDVKDCLTFTVDSHRYRKHNTKVVTVPVRVVGELAERLKSNLGVGSKLRVVGRIDQTDKEDGDFFGMSENFPVLFLEAEHIEIKPERV